MAYSMMSSAVGGGDEDLDTAGALSRYAEAFDEGYKETYEVDEAVADLLLAKGVCTADELRRRREERVVRAAEEAASKALTAAVVALREARKAIDG